MGIVGGDFAIGFMGNEAFSGEVWKRRKSLREKGRGSLPEIFCAMSISWAPPFWQKVEFNPELRDWSFLTKQEFLTFSLIVGLSNE